MERVDQLKHIEIAALVAEESNDCIYLSDPVTYELLYINKMCRRLLGNPADEQWRGKPCYQILQNQSAPCAFCNNRTLNTEEFCLWNHYNAALGRQFIMRDKLVDLDGQLVRLEIASDVTEIEQANVALRHQLHTEKTLLECVRCLSAAPSADGAVDRLLSLVGSYYDGDRAYVFKIDREQGVMTNTHEWCRDGVEPQLKNLNALDLSSSRRWMALFQDTGHLYIPNLDESVDHSSSEYQILSAQGISSLIAAPLLSNGKISGFVGVDNPRDNVQDMTLLCSLSSFIVEELSKRKLTQRLQYLSYTDSLTGAGNRRKYIELVEALEVTPPSSLGVVYLDINGLRQINENYGHEYGDYLLRHTAQTLMELCPGQVYRVGGDEFVLLCPDISNQQFDDLVNTLYLKSSQDQNFKPALGSSWSEGPDLNVSRQITCSDQALSVNKQDYYLRKLEGGGDYHVQMTQRLRDELACGCFFVYLQPQLDLKTGALRGAEALVRRQDEAGRLIPPLRFIPLYEAEGVVRHVDLFVLETVCATLQSWASRTKGALPPIAVNFSRVTMMEHDIVSKLLETCSRYQVSPSSIKIEVTESIGSIDSSTLNNLIHALSCNGFSISLDDFGAEYSNLALLSSIHLDELKLDKSLINHLGINTNTHIVTAHTIEVCRELNGIVSVAEGVERREQREILVELGCDIGQGFLFDRPMPLDRFEEKYILLDLLEPSTTT